MQRKHHEGLKQLALLETLHAGNNRFTPEHFKMTYHATNPNGRHTLSMQNKLASSYSSISHACMGSINIG
eukprot:850742-Amphidinium_carterae.1